MNDSRSRTVAVSDLTQMHQMIGRLVAASEESLRLNNETKQAVVALHRRIDDTNKEAAENRGAITLQAERHDRLRQEVDTDIKPTIADYKKNKARGYGILAGLGLGGGTLGAFISNLIQRSGS